MGRWLKGPRDCRRRRIGRRGEDIGDRTPWEMNTRTSVVVENLVDHARRKLYEIRAMTFFGQRAGARGLVRLWGYRTAAPDLPSSRHGHVPLRGPQE